MFSDIWHMTQHTHIHQYLWSGEIENLFNQSNQTTKFQIEYTNRTKTVRGDAQKINSIFADNGLIKFYFPLSYPIFDNLFLEKEHQIWSNTLPIEFLTKIY